MFLAYCVHEFMRTATFSDMQVKVKTGAPAKEINLAISTQVNKCAYSDSAISFLEIYLRNILPVSKLME